KTHAEKWRLWPEASNDFRGDARVLRATGTRRDQNLLGRHRLHLTDRHLIVAAHADVGAQLAQVLHEVVGKRVVVVDDEDHERPACASSRARMTALALSRVSSYSAAGFESATIPAPACTYARPFSMTTVRIVMQKSRLPAKSTYPTAPAYTPRRSFSSSAMISIARTLCAPETVPAGKHATSASSRSCLSSSLPSTIETRCMTCEYRSIVMY